jgi:hypothetical protein
VHVRVHVCFVLQTEQGTRAHTPFNLNDGSVDLAAATSDGTLACENTATVTVTAADATATATATTEAATGGVFADNVVDAVVRWNSSKHTFAFLNDTILVAAKTATANTATTNTAAANTAANTATANTVAANTATATVDSFAAATAVYWNGAANDLRRRLRSAPLRSRQLLNCSFARAYAPH